MKSILLLICIAFCLLAKSQTFPPITDTIESASWEDAMDMTFGLLPQTHFPSGHLFNKSAFPSKFNYANGQLNDSSFNMLEFYFLENIVRGSYNNPDSIIGYIRLDSLKNLYIEEHNILPWGIIDIEGQKIKDSAILDGSMGVISHRLVEKTVNLAKIYTSQKLFCVAPLNLEVFTLNPQFIVMPVNIFSNNNIPITTIEVDLDDGLGYRFVTIDIPFQAVYTNGGFKKYITRIVYTNNDTLYSRSELNIIDNSAKPSGFNYEVPEDVYIKYISGPRGQGLSTDYNYPSEFTPAVENGRFAEVGVWYGCGNVSKKIRKPYIIFGGYNPKDGKSLNGNGNAAWVNAYLGGILALEGWRGPMYETYNGFFTDASKNANGAQAFGSNGNNLLDKIRNEGYDVIIVRFNDGIGYLQTTAFLGSIVLKDINAKIMAETDNVLNPGADLDPEAPGYPASTKIKRAKHELILSGYSAGALSGRMALLLMEYEHEKYRCDLVSNHVTSNHNLSPLHRTKLWIGLDHESQGSNTSIGQQMFMDFQRSLQFLPANIADVVNSYISKNVLDLLNHRGVTTQNTLYNYTNMYNIGGHTWNVGHHSDFNDYFSDLTMITPVSYPANLIGYPLNCYRISVSQGNANGISQLLGNNTNLIYNQSPSTWCASPAGTNLGPGGGVTPYRLATARVLSSWNNDAFDCKFGTNIQFAFYSVHINLTHWKYHSQNYIQDQDLSSYQPYDVATGSTLPAHIILGKNLPLSTSIVGAAAFSYCNLVDWNGNQAGFAPTVSGLDLHLPGSNTLPRLPNLNLVPGNVSGGLNLMYENKYSAFLNTNVSPNGDFGFPHLTFPTNHYDYTPYDAIWANTTNNTNYDDNTIHVEDPNPLSGEFLAEEIAPLTLYLSNRIIMGEIYNCGNALIQEKYYADFEARNSVLSGNQTIYEHNQTSPYQRVRTSPGDFIIDDGAVVTIRANNDDGVSSVVLGAGFSAKQGSILRAYVYHDPNSCGPFSYASSRPTSSNQKPDPPTNESRPIVSKRAVGQSLALGSESAGITLYPNPTAGYVFYALKSDAVFNYIITDVSGRELEKGLMKVPDSKIDLSRYKEGVYFITIFSNKLKQTDRIIIQ